LQPDLNAPQPDDDESASATTQLPYDLDVGLSGSPQIIQQGSDTLLHATVHNAGNAQSSTLTVATGGTVDTRLPLRAGCTMDSAQATVTCATGVIAAGGTYAADISIASAPTATSMTSTATVTPQADNPPDGSDETASWTTTVTSTAQAFVPQTGALSFASSDSVVNDTFSVPQGSAPGIFLTLDEATVSAVCGTGTCNPHAAEAVFPATGQYAATDPSHPLVFDITYNVKQVCNGLGTPSGCLPIFWMEPGQTVATQVLQCPTYSQTTRQAPRMNNGNAPCLNFVFKTTGIVTYEVALIKDIVIPFLGSQKSGG
jgi:hypothetical protein